MAHRSLFAATALVGLGAGMLYVASAYGADAAPCNPYYPLATGASWTYREGPLGKPTLLEKTSVVKSVSREGARETATLEQTVRSPEVPGVAAGRAETTVQCDAGRISIIVKGQARGQDGGQQATGSVIARLPGLAPAKDLVPGYEWSAESQIEALEGDRRIVTRGVRKNRVEATEAVSVPAGKFSGALRIAAIETLETKGSDGTRSARQELVEWYVRGVGLVKRETRVQSSSGQAVSVEELSASNLRPSTK